MSNKLTFSGTVAVSFLNAKQISLTMQRIKTIIQENLIFTLFSGSWCLVSDKGEEHYGSYQHFYVTSWRNMMKMIGCLMLMLIVSSFFNVLLRPLLYFLSCFTPGSFFTDLKLHKVHTMHCICKTLILCPYFFCQNGF